MLYRYTHTTKEGIKKIRKRDMRARNECFITLSFHPYRIIFVWKMCAPRTRRRAARWDTLRVCVCVRIFLYMDMRRRRRRATTDEVILWHVCVWAGGRFGWVVNRWTTWIYLMGPSCSRDGWCPLYFRGGCGLQAHTRGRGIKNDAALYSPLKGACHHVAAATIHVRV